MGNKNNNLLEKFKKFSEVENEPFKKINSFLDKEKNEFYKQINGKS